MARVNVEQKALTDARFYRLGHDLGAPQEFAHAVGLVAMIRIWNECIERGDYAVDGWLIQAALGRQDACELVCAADLAVKVRSGKFRVKGTEGRVEYLQKLRESGKANGPKGSEFGKLGGRPRKPGNRVSGNGATGIAGNPPPTPTLTPAPAPTPVLRIPEAVADAPAPTPAPHKLVVDAWERLYVARTGCKYGWSDKRHHGQIQSALKLAKGNPADVIARATRLFNAPPSLLARDNSPPEVGDLLTHWNRLVEPSSRAGPLFAGTRGHAPPSDASEFGDGDVNRRGGT